MDNGVRPGRTDSPLAMHRKEQFHSDFCENRWTGPVFGRLQEEDDFGDES